MSLRVENKAMSDFLTLIGLPLPDIIGIAEEVDKRDREKSEGQLVNRIKQKPLKSSRRNPKRNAL